MTSYYAHSPVQGETWHLLSDHLHHTAQLASRFAEPLGFPAWGYLAGWLHDLGKSSAEFQAYLERSGSEAHLEQRPGKVDHSSAGAQEAVRLLPELGKLLAYALAGHHGGLLEAYRPGEARRRFANNLKTALYWVLSNG